MNPFDSFAVQIRKLTAADVPALLALLNRTFSAENERFESFPENFPRIFGADCARHAPEHMGAFADGRLIGAAASYSLEYHIGDRVLHLNGGGNIAVAAEARGRGVMSALLRQIRTETAETADLSYLHGKIDRYRRFGYESCGTEYRIRFSRHRMKSLGVGAYRFDDLRHTDIPPVLHALSQQRYEHVARTRAELLPALCSCGRIPVGIRDGDRAVGYFSYDPLTEVVEEFAFEPSADLPAILAAWMSWTQTDVSLRMAPYDLPMCQTLLRAAEDFVIGAPALFRVHRFDRVVETLLHNRAQYQPNLPQGTLCIGSNCFPAPLTVSYIDGRAAAVYTPGAQPDCVRNDAEIYAFLFGSAPRILRGHPSDAWFPLPLYVPYLT